MNYIGILRMCGDYSWQFVHFSTQRHFSPYTRRLSCHKRKTSLSTLDFSVYTEIILGLHLLQPELDSFLHIYGDYPESKDDLGIVCNFFLL